MAIDGTLGLMFLDFCSGPGGFLPGERVCRDQGSFQQGEGSRVVEALVGQART